MSIVTSKIFKKITRLNQRASFDQTYPPRVQLTLLSVLLTLLIKKLTLLGGKPPSNN